MPKYDNQIQWSGGFKFGQGKPADDRTVFVSLANANAYIVTDSFFIYEGLSIWIEEEDGFFYARRSDPSLPYDSVTNPYIWVPRQTIPPFGLEDQHLVVNNSELAEWQFSSQRNLYKFSDVVAINNLTEGMFILHTGVDTFMDLHDPSNYTISNPDRLPVYFIFKIVGDDMWVGKSGIYNTVVAHNVTQRKPLYFNTQYIIGGGYYENTLTTTPSAIVGEINYQAGIALDATHILVDLTQGWKLVTANSGGGGTGNAFIFRIKIQKFGNGGISGISVGDNVTFTVPHGFGSATGIVQVVDLGADGLLPGTMVSVNNIIFNNGEVKVNIDYGLVDDTNILEVILIF